MPPVLSRLFSPAGFVLMGLLLLLPFVGVSCSDQELGTMDASYTGFDLVTGADPDFDVESVIADQVAQGSVEMPTPGVPALAGLLLALLVIGACCAVLPRPATRLLAACVVAACAAVLLVFTQVAAQSGLADSILENARALQQFTPQDMSPVANEAYVSDAIGTRAGFWVVLVALVLLAAVNAAAAIRARAPRRVTER